MVIEEIGDFGLAMGMLGADDGNDIGEIDGTQARCAWFDDSKKPQEKVFQLSSLKPTNS